MQSFKLNETDILSNQDWTFPTNIAYGPGRLKEIGSICKIVPITKALINYIISFIMLVFLTLEFNAINISCNKCNIDINLE